MLVQHKMRLYVGNTDIKNCILYILKLNLLTKSLSIFGRSGSTV